MGTIADKLKNIRKAKKDLADKFYIGDDVKLSDYVNRISNTDDIKLGVIDTDKNFQELIISETGNPLAGVLVEVETFYSYDFNKEEQTTETEVVEGTTTKAKLQNILNSKNAIKEKFSLGETVLADYPANIETGDVGLLGYIDDDKNFQDLVFKGNNGLPKNTAKEVEFYSYYTNTQNPLTFTAEEAGSTITLNAIETEYSSPTTSGLQYRYGTSGKWITYTCGTTLTLENIGDKVQFQNTEETLSHSTSGFVQFSITGKIAALGTIQSMLNYSESCSDYCYTNMFYGCTGLTSAPELPATTLTTDCYYGMFRGCTGLTSAPELPATTLAEGCYSDMFRECTNLTSAPELPVTTLAEGCYHAMFRGCTGLTSAPELPATTLAEGCYSNMFRGCTGLTSAPELPATTLVDYCYYYMFYGCSNLSYIKIGFTIWSASYIAYATSHWVYEVASNGTFKCPSALDTTVDRSSSTIPEGWTVENY